MIGGPYYSLIHSVWGAAGVERSQQKCAQALFGQAKSFEILAVKKSVLHTL